MPLRSKNQGVVRQSSRLSNAKEDVGSPLSQSRITEFVSARKRALEPSLFGKKMIEAPKEAVGNSVVLPPQTSTPVKIKKRTRKVVSPLKNGILTPSPSLESVNGDKDIGNEENVKLNSVEEAILNSIEEATLISVKESKSNSVEESKSSSENQKTPAYKRFAHLVDDLRNQRPRLSTEAQLKLDQQESNSQSEKLATGSDSLKPHKYVPWLPLSERWSFYDKLVFNVDSMCVLSAGRSQPCIFHKVQKSLENVIGKKVALDHLERIKTLWPEAYEYRPADTIMQGRRVESVAISIPDTDLIHGSASQLADRRDVIKSKIQAVVIKAHNEFVMEKLKCEIPANAVLKQWHPEFDQNSMAEIIQAPLLPPKSNHNYDTQIPIPIPIQKIVSSLPSTPKKSLNLEDAMHVKDEKAVKSPAPTAPSSPAPAATLLERIRAKEQKLQAEKLFGADADHAREQAILSQMERFTQSVSFAFASSKKSVLFLTDLTNILIQSSKIPISPMEVVERLKLLQRIVPKWISIVESHDENAPRCVKILDKTVSLREILTLLQDATRRKAT